MSSIFQSYANKVCQILDRYDWGPVETLAENLKTCWECNRQVFVCGNGGSAANAVHMANDFLYGVASNVDGPGIRIEALSSNTAVLTCLANDVGYEQVFSEQLRVKAQTNDVLVCLSGSGNSENIVRALTIGSELNMSTYAILGYSGGRCLELADVAIHFPINDMQIAEDLQLVVAHMCMQWVKEKSNKCAR